MYWRNLQNDALADLVIPPSNYTCTITHLQASGVPAANTCLAGFNNLQEIVSVRTSETCNAVSGMQVTLGSMESNITEMINKSAASILSNQTAGSAINMEQCMPVVISQLTEVISIAIADSCKRILDNIAELR